MAHVDQNEVDRIARLARLALSDDAEKTMAAQLQTILGYVEKLNGVNTDEVPPTNQVTEQTDVFRPDAVVPARDAVVEALLAAAPQQENRAVKVKAVLPS